MSNARLFGIFHPDTGQYPDDLPALTLHLKCWRLPPASILVQKQPAAMSEKRAKPYLSAHFGHADCLSDRERSILRAG
ncbi:hypothetical protein FB99_34530 [Pantoea agglomerans]|nr:hypothetical protein FB99_34530 [Pantoea agglomerans]